MGTVSDAAASGAALYGVTGPDEEKKDETILTGGLASPPPARTGGTGGTGVTGLGERSLASSAVRSELGVSYEDPDPAFGEAIEYILDPEQVDPPYTSPLYPGASEFVVYHGPEFDVEAARRQVYATQDLPQSLDEPHEGYTAKWRRKQQIFGADVEAREKDFLRKKQMYDTAMETRKRVRDGQPVSAEALSLYSRVDELEKDMNAAEAYFKEVAPGGTSPGAKYYGQEATSTRDKYMHLFESSEESDPRTGAPTLYPHDVMEENVEDAVGKLEDDLRELWAKKNRVQKAINKLKRDSANVYREAELERPGGGGHHLTFGFSGPARIKANIERQIELLRRHRTSIGDAMTRNREDKNYLIYTLRKTYGTGFYPPMEDPFAVETGGSGTETGGSGAKKTRPGALGGTWAQDKEGKWVLVEGE